MKVDTTTDSKRLRHSSSENRLEASIYHPTLRLYYRHILTLREYLLSQLPKHSRRRRRRISTLGRDLTGKATKTEASPLVNRLEQGGHNDFRVKADCRDHSLAQLLDKTVVCSLDQNSAPDQACYAQDLEAFSQQINPTAGSSIGGGSCSQSELVDFAIWLLFHRVYRRSNRPPHLLCHGYQHARGPQRSGDDLCAVAGIPGIVSYYPNRNVSILKSAEWDDVLSLLGNDGEKVMLDMILRRGIFVSVEKGRDNLLQLSGKPMTDLEVLEPVARIARPLQAKSKTEKEHKLLSAAQGTLHEPRSPAKICFVRNRMFYARAALNAKGKVTFGLRHIHALNRYSNASNSVHTFRLLQYIFPREFGLHNVFTSIVDPTETVQPFKDYTLREVEILRMKQGFRSGRIEVLGQRIPKRLHGRPVELIRKLQTLHARCSYLEKLKHYCPLRYLKPTNVQHIPGDVYEKKAADFVSYSPKPTQASKYSLTVSQHAASDAKSSFFDLATPHANVSAFCRATISDLIPNGFWGEGDLGRENRRSIMHNVDRFVRLRRFEPMSLHVVSQNLKVEV